MKRIVSILTTVFLLMLFGCAQQGKTVMADDEISQSIEAFKNRPIYKTLTPDLIAKIKDEELEQVVFDNISVQMKDDGREEKEIVQSLTSGQRAVYVTVIIEGEVSNGGFNQFYYNPSGQLADMGEESFKTLGAGPFAELMNRANSTYSEIKSDLDKFNDGTIEGFSKSYENNPLNDLDSIFYKLSEEESLNQLRIKYIRNNVKEFVNN